MLFFSFFLESLRQYTGFSALQCCPKSIKTTLIRIFLYIQCGLDLGEAISLLHFRNIKFHTRGSVFWYFGFYHSGFGVPELVFRILPFRVWCSGFSIPGFTIPDLMFRYLFFSPFRNPLFLILLHAVFGHRGK